MTTTSSEIDLGFAFTAIPVGTHVCQIYSDDAERRASIEAFLLRGLQARECCSCFSDKLNTTALAAFLGEHELNFDSLVEAGALVLAGARQTYFGDDKFDPDQVLERMDGFYSAVCKAGFSGIRVIGEMDPRIQEIDGGECLIEYESKVNLYLRDHPVTTVCQYNALDFDGAAIMDVLKVHPMMVVRGAVVHNPFYEAPEELLS